MYKLILAYFGILSALIICVFSWFIICPYLLNMKSTFAYFWGVGIMFSSPVISVILIVKSIKEIRK